MIARLSSNWWLFLIRGILALALGIVMPLVPAAAILTLAFLFGAYALVDGVVAIASAIRMRHRETSWAWLLVEGAIGVAVGMLTFVYPSITALVLVYLFAWWAILSGAVAIATALRLRAVVPNEWLTIALGALSIVAGIVIFFVPAAGVLAIVWTISIYAILAGIFMIGLALRLRGIGSRASGFAA